MCLWGAAATADSRPAKRVYPPSEKVDQVDDYHGTPVADPYRWLEELDSDKTRKWVNSQNEVTFAYLDQIPARARIRERLTKLWNYERYTNPIRRGERYFFSKNDGLQNQNVVYTVDGLNGSPRVLLDPNKLSADGTVALSGVSYTDDGKLMAYSLSTAGSDWQEWRVRDVATGQDRPDLLKWVKFSGAAWTKDGKGFFYSRYDEPADTSEGARLTGTNYFQKLYYHALGTPQSEDQLVYERKDQKEWGFAGQVTDDGRYLVISVWQGTDPKNRVFYRDLQAPGAKVVELLNDFDASYNFINNDGPVFWFQTDLEAPRSRIIAIDVTAPDRRNWKEIVPQSPETLVACTVLDDKFLGVYLKDAATQVKVFSLHGAFLRTVDLPGIGSASGFDGLRGDKETFYTFTGFTTPGTIYRYDVASGKSTMYRKPEVDFEPDAFETRQVFYHSKDGTRVPLFITARKGLKLDGRNPTYLYGYGGFNVSLTPGFSVANLVWMEMGGVYAVANLRGGGEYGEEWHQAGTKLRKQNVFDDFIAAAEYLIANKYTTPARLSIGGGSNGGLLVGAAITQRPELFGAALPAVGVMDMLRFHKFTIGWAWVSDYGSADNPEEFKALKAYSPLHNIEPGVSYPATMVTTADHDDRVVPGHSFKFAAALQEAQAGPAPVLIRVETKAGHGAGKPTSKLIEEVADKWSFLARELGMEMGMTPEASGGK
ncbi:MAG TPA: prolyl oligopeptidase family serine peptidase [Candidatus Polarisedimenticolia bacterium]|nr:prolyl oligopeptidase family serine peptidase [Candidatus Polarisedimenticolia bacterium]